MLRENTLQQGAGGAQVETDRIVRLGLLYDFYGSLLTEKQRSVVERYCFDDLSLAEISAEEGNSRQAVHDLLQRVEELLENYEARLALIEKYHANQKTISEILASAKHLIELNPPAEIRSEIERLVQNVRLLQEED
ncbi:MAG TPA: DNA-binding protein [Firmicutes bacterium]|nr:DNA-binding protein [Bacillota bacterium]HBL69119.1 DNA-binding protein [Bacillota bacterium]HCT36082.1 DNA-binding protein [Bacillota bacterium]